MKKTTQKKTTQHSKTQKHKKAQPSARAADKAKREAAAKRKDAIEKKNNAVKENDTKSSSEIDIKIDSAMEKIIQDTIGSQEYIEPVQKSGKKRERRKDRKKNNETGRKYSMGTKIAIGTAAGVIILAAAAYGTGTYYYKDKFFKGTSINHISCENLTVDETEELIRKKVEDYSLSVEFRGEQTREISGKDIGYEYVSDGSVSRLLENQNPFAWIKGYFGDTDYEAGENIKYNKEDLKSKLYAFDLMKAENMTAPTDAYIAFQDNQFVIMEETQGTSIDAESLLLAVEQSINNSESTVSAEETKSYILPSITKDNETLVHQRDVWNSCAAVTVMYTFGDKTEILDGMTVKDWMTYDEAGNYVENQEVLEQNIQNYVAWLADTYNTLGKDRVITSSATGEPVTVKGGNYGFQINQKKERAQLLEDIKGHVSTAREPVYSKTGQVYGENDIGSTYVEIDLTSQHLWFYKEGELIVDTDLVSGTYVRNDMKTPGGSYSLMYKQKNQVLRGRQLEDGSYEYEQPVKYWMPFNGGIGLHDANWRNSFGGSIYKYSGSHGCINLPTKAAEIVYENIEAGYPVICFYR